MVQFFSLLPFLIIVAYFSRFRLMKVVIVVSVISFCPLIFNAYFQDIFRDLFLHQSEALLIINAYNTDSCTAAVLEILTKSYIPNASITYRDEEDENSICVSKNGYLSISNEYDPRLLPALWFSYLSLKLRQQDFKNINELLIPFSWDSFLDLQSRLNLQHHPLRNLNCSSFYDFNNGLNGTDFLSSCQDLQKSESKGGIRFKIFQPVEASASEAVRKIIGSSYLMHSAPPPEKLFLLGVGPNRSGLIVPTYALKGYGRSDLFYFIRNHTISLRGDKSISIHEEVGGLMESLSLPIANISYFADDELTDDKFRLIISGENNINSLSKDDFFLQLGEGKSFLKDKLIRSLNSTLQHKFYEKMLSQIDIVNSTREKYFHEATVVGETDNHYDWRFFKQLHYSDYERKAIFHRLSRAWLRFSNTLGITTWIAHGSLLGWYWNGMSLPWDQDLDVQITMKSLIKIAKYYNQSLVLDLTDHEFNLNLGIGSYLVDVSSAFFDRQKGNGENMIDARFIDTETGFYVDITALAFTNAANDIPITDKLSSELNQVLDNDFVMKDDSHTILKENLYKDLSIRKTELWMDQNIFNCKDNHFYTLEDLNPLIPTLFEGSIAYVPRRFEQILQREYNRGLLYHHYAGHVFRPVLDLWVPRYICKDDYIGNKCFDRETLLEMEYTKPLTKMHRTEMLNQNRGSYSINDEIAPFRLDPWIIRRANKIKRCLETR